MKTTAICFGVFCLTCVMMTSCEYTKPGSSGTIPAMDPDKQNGGYNGVFIISVLNYLPYALQCDSEYVFTVTAHDFPVNCQAYDYNMLYQEAFRHVRERVDETHCPHGCPQKNPQILFQQGVCNDVLGFVKIRAAIHCVKDAAAISPGLEEMTQDQLRQSFKDSLEVPMPPDDESLLVRITPDEHSEDCPYDFKFIITLNERIPSCDMVKTYLPFIHKVRQKAKQISAATRCGPNCTTRDVHELGMTWNCQQGVVHVEYAFEVQCRK